MLKYEVNINKLTRQQFELSVVTTGIVDFNDLRDDDNYIIPYEGSCRDKLMVNCQITDIDRISQSSYVPTKTNVRVGTNVYTVDKKYPVYGLNKTDKRFSFLIDRYYNLPQDSFFLTVSEPESVSDYYDEDTAYITFTVPHYFDINTPQYYNIYNIVTLDEIPSDGEPKPEYINVNGVNYAWSAMSRRYVEYNIITYNAKWGNDIVSIGDDFFIYNDEDQPTTYQRMPVEEMPVEPSTNKYNDQNYVKYNGNLYHWEDDSYELCESEEDINPIPTQYIGSHIRAFDASSNEYITLKWTGQAQLYFKYVDDEGITVCETIQAKYVSDTTLGISKHAFGTKLYNKLFANSALTSTPDGIWAYYANIDNLSVHRDAIVMADNAQMDVYYERILAELPLTLSSTFDTNLLQEDALNAFVEEEKKKSINEGVDMEKDVYYPVILDANRTLKDVYTIKFNLHFREHRGNNWIVDNNSTWNGVQQTETNGETTYQINTDITSDTVSDALTFLGFTNKDVYFQKNKLKKSFLRLSFYDSLHQGRQNLIAYSTVFMDCGWLFSKYAKNIEEGGYIAINADKDSYGVYNPEPKKTPGQKMQYKTGIRVNREPITIVENIQNNNAEIIQTLYYKDEEKRLSSQFVVKSKNRSKASSEGFYLYLWKDNESTLPQDLYLKVEFNHAGYGRIIPFMMPFWDIEKYTINNNITKQGIKTFQEIIDDWTNPNENNDGPYGINQYLKFCYIHLKYRYDKDNDRHIYYLDPYTYGNNIEYGTDETGNQCLIINLYEAKVN